MAFTRIGSIKFTLVVVPILIGMMAGSGFAQTEQHSKQSESSELSGLNTDDETEDQMLVHLEIEKLARSRTGQILFDSVGQIPSLSKQLATIPKNLKFLKEAEFESITLFVTGNERRQGIFLEVDCKLEEEKLFDLLSHANGYTKVQFDGVDIHHWVTDFGMLGDQVIGKAEQPWADNQLDSIYLAVPKTGHVWVSTSLADLTDALTDKEHLPSNRMAMFDRFGEGENLIAAFVSVDGDEVPGDLSLVVRENQKGRLGIHAALKSRNEAEKQVTSMVHSMLSNPAAASQMFAVVPNPNHKAETKPMVKNVAANPLSEADKAKLRRTARESFGLQLNSATIDPSDIGKMIQQFLAECVSCKMENESLLLDVHLFVGPSRVENISWDSEKGKAMGLNYNTMQYVLNVYSSEKERRAALLTAEKRNSELNRR